MNAIAKKPVFDFVRRLMGRGFTQAEVNELDRLLEGSNRKPDAPTIPEQRDVPSRISAQGIALLHRFEGCAKRKANGRYEAYPDPGSRDGHPWTIGWGSTGLDTFNGGRIERGTVWTKQQCDERFEADLRRYSEAVVRALGSSIASTSQAQFDALVSFHYNTGAISRATLTRKHKAGDYAGAAREFARWVKNDGRVMQGLVRRRAAEAELYRSGS